MSPKKTHSMYFSFMKCTSKPTLALTTYRLISACISTCRPSGKQVPRISMRGSELPTGLCSQRHGNKEAFDIQQISQSCLKKPPSMYFSSMKRTSNPAVALTTDRLISQCISTCRPSAKQVPRISMRGSELPTGLCSQRHGNKEAFDIQQISQSCLKKPPSMYFSSMKRTSNPAVALTTDRLISQCISTCRPSAKQVPRISMRVSELPTGLFQEAFDIRLVTKLCMRD